MTDTRLYDEETNALTIYFDEATYGRRYDHTVDHGFMCLLDVDGDGNLIGIEILLPEEVKYAQDT